MAHIWLTFGSHRNLSHTDGHRKLAAKPSNTFLKAIEKVLEGFVKNFSFLVK
jgi:hypothetical protein